MSSIKNSSGLISTHFMENLLYGLSHDMGAPLRHIVQFSQLLNTLNTENTEKQTRWQSMILESGVQLQEMIADISVFSRFLITIRDSNPEEFDLNILFKSVLAKHKKNHPEKSFVISLSENYQLLFGYYEHWEALLACLIDNATKYHPSTDEHQIKVNVSLTNENNILSLKVADNGIGVHESKYSLITRPFKRLNCVDGVSGKGMGLAYCQFIAELNQGELHFDKSQDNGLQVIYRQPLLKNSNY